MTLSAGKDRNPYVWRIFHKSEMKITETRSVTLLCSENMIDTYQVVGRFQNHQARSIPVFGNITLGLCLASILCVFSHFWCISRNISKFDWRGNTFSHCVCDHDAWRTIRSREESLELAHSHGVFLSQYSFFLRSFASLVACLVLNTWAFGEKSRGKLRNNTC